MESHTIVFRQRIGKITHSGFAREVAYTGGYFSAKRAKEVAPDSCYS
jgi:hypothetical protein